MQCKLQEEDQEMQCKLQQFEKKNEGFQVMFNEAFKRNTQLQQEKEDQEPSV